MDNINNNNLIESLKTLINEDNIKISNENKSVILEKIETYITFIKTKSETPDKIQSFEKIKEDWLLFLYFFNNIEKQFNFLELYFKLQLSEEDKTTLKNYLEYFFKARSIIFAKLF
jgi:hypothetical protein